MLGARYHCKDGRDCGTETRAKSEKTGEDGEDSERDGDQEEGKHESGGVIIKALVCTEGVWNGVCTVKVSHGVEWVRWGVGSTIDVFAIGGCTADSPKSPLSVACC